MKRNPSAQGIPQDARESPQFAIACRGAIKFLTRKHFNKRGDQPFNVCDSGCRSKPVAHGASATRSVAAGFIQILDGEPIPLCAKCLKEAKKALAEIEDLIVESPEK